MDQEAQRYKEETEAQIQLAEEREKPSQSRYELTLAEFPIFLLSKGGKSPASIPKSIEYEDTITGKDKQPIQRKWRVLPDSETGFGTASTLSTLFELFQIWKEASFNDQRIQFGSIYNLLKRQGQKTSNQQYRQITRDLLCLVGVRIEAVNAFWDNKRKAYVDMTFHLFDRLQLYKAKPTTQATLPFSYIKASDVLYGSVQKNSLLTANFNSRFFHNLTPVEKRLALYLTKVFRSQAVHKRELQEFAQQMPIHAKQLKHVREQLKKACSGLIEKGFDQLANLSFEKTRGREFIVFKKKGQLPLPLNTDQHQTSSWPGSEHIKSETEADLISQDILKICEDTKSLPFYKQVAKHAPRAAIYQALDEVKEAAKQGNITKTKGALFTTLVKKYSKDRGVKI